MRSIFDAEKDSFAQKVLGKQTASARELFDWQKGQFERSNEKQAAARMIEESVMRRSLEDAFSGGDTPFVESVAKDIEAAGDLFDEEEKSRLWEKAEELDKQIRASQAQFAPEARYIFNALRQYSGESAGFGAPEMADLAGRLAKLPTNQRRAIMQLAGSFGQLQQIDKGFWYQMAESIGRGTTDFSERIPRNTKEQTLRGNLRLLKSDQPVFKGVGLDGAVAYSAAGETPITPEEREQAIQDAEQQVGVLMVQRELRELAETQIDPIKTVTMLPSWVEEGLYGAARSIPYTAAAAVPVVGVFGVAAALYSQFYDQMMVEYPDANPDDVALVAAIGAPVAAGLERLKLNTIMGRLPIFGKLVERLVHPNQKNVYRIMWRGGGMLAEQNVQEFAQERVYPLGQSIASALGADIPSYDWEKWYQNLDRELLVQFVALLPLSLLGMGVIRHQEIKRGDAYLKDKPTLMKMLSEAATDRVLGAATTEEAQAIFREEYAKRTPEEAKAAAQRVVDEVVAVRQQQQSPDMPKLERRGAEYVVVSSDGQTLAASTDQTTAEQALLSASREVVEKELMVERQRFADTTQEAQTLKEWWLAEDPKRQANERRVIREGDNEITAQQKLEMLEKAGNRQGIEELHRRIAQSPYAGTAYDKIFILGEASVEQVGEMVFQSVIALNPNSDVRAAREEMHHTAVRVAVANGRADESMLRGWLEQSERVFAEKGVDIALPRADMTDIVESMAVMQEAFENERISADVEMSLPQAFVDYIKRMIEVFVEVLKRGKALREAFDAGALPSEFEAFLAETTGVADQTVVDRSREKTAQEVAPEVANYSIGDEGQKRAKAGGEFGPNGEWYEGGTWIARTDMPKKERDRIRRAATGRERIEVGNVSNAYAVPAAGKIPIVARLMGTFIGNDGAANEQAMSYYQLDDEHKAQIREVGKRYASGERYVDVVEFPKIANFADVARMMEAGLAIPRELIAQLPEGAAAKVVQENYSIGLREPDAFRFNEQTLPNGNVRFIAYHGSEQALSEIQDQPIYVSSMSDGAGYGEPTRVIVEGKFVSENEIEAFAAKYGIAMEDLFHEEASMEQDLQEALRTEGYDGAMYYDQRRDDGEVVPAAIIVNPSAITIRESDDTTEAGTLAPDTDLTTLDPDQQQGEGWQDIPWEQSEKNYSIAPAVLPEAFPILDKALYDQILAETDTTAAIHIDRLRVGEYEGVMLQGGMYFPAIVENLKNGVVWAFNSKGVASAVAERARANGGYVKLVLMLEGNVIGNKTFATIWFKQLRKNIKAGKITTEQALAEINAIRERYVTRPVKGVTTKFTGHDKLFTTLKQVEKALMDMPQIKRGNSYFQKTSTVTKRDGEKMSYQSLLSQAMTAKGFPDAAKIVESIEEPAFKGLPKGTIVGLIKIDPDAVPMTAAEAGVTEHISYGYVLKGKPVARMAKHQSIDALYPQISGKLMSQQAMDFPASQVLNYSISTQSEIDRVGAALNRLDRDPLDSLGYTEKLRQRFAKIMAENMVELQAMQQGGVAERTVLDEEGNPIGPQPDAAKTKATGAEMRRTKLLQALGELDGLLSVLPPQVAAKVGGYTVLTNIGTGDRALSNFFIKRLEMIDKELERYLKDRYTTALKKLFKRAKPKRDDAGKVPKGKLGAGVHTLFERLEMAVEMSSVEIDGEIASLEQQIASGELEPEQEAASILLSDALPLFGEWKTADASRMAQAVQMGYDIYRVAYKKQQAKALLRKNMRDQERIDAKDSSGAPDDTAPVRQQNKNEAEMLKSKTKGIVTNLLGFDQLMSLVFGRDSAFTKKWVNWQRKSDNAKDDEFNAVYDQWAKFLATLTKHKKPYSMKATYAGQDLSFEMAEPKHKIKHANPFGEEVEFTFSQADLLDITMMWMQPKGRAHMIGKLDDYGDPIDDWNYDQTFVNKAEALLTDEAKAIRDFLLNDYAEQWSELNEVFVKLNDINLPQEQFYSPLSVNPVQTTQNQTVDPLTGFAVAVPNRTPPSLRSRGASVAEPVFNNAINKWFAHRLQMAHWKAYAEFNNEALSVLGHRNVRNAIEAKVGQAGLTSLQHYLTYFQQGGNRAADANLELTKALRGILGRAITMSLFGRIGTVLIQFTQLGAAAAKMPLHAYLRRFSKLMTGQMGWGEALKSPYIQRRIAQMPPQVQVAMAGLRANKPSQIREAARRVGWLLSGNDGLATAGTYAMVYDYQLEQMKKAGMTGAQAEAAAREEAERATDEIAQPTRAGARSAFELSQTSPLQTVAWAFASEPRKNISLLAYLQRAKRPLTEKGRAMLYVFIINGVFAALMRTMLRDLRDDEDDEIFDWDDTWSPKRLALMVMTEPLYGVPVLGEMAEEAIFRAFREYRPEGSLYSVADPAFSLSRVPEHFSNLLEGELDGRRLVKDINNILRGFGYAYPTAAGAAALSNLGKEVYEMADTIFGDDDQ
jgi:hypothetical protein